MVLQFGPEAQSATFFLSASHIPVRPIQLRLIPNHNGHVLCICRRLTDALTMPLIVAGHTVFACTDHYILHRKEK